MIDDEDNVDEAAADDDDRLCKAVVYNINVVQFITILVGSNMYFNDENIPAT